MFFHKYNSFGYILEKRLSIVANYVIFKKRIIVMPFKQKIKRLEIQDMFLNISPVGWINSRQTRSDFSEKSNTVKSFLGVCYVSGETCSPPIEHCLRARLNHDPLSSLNI